MPKKITKNKLDSIPKINRRLFKLWSLAVRERAGHKCELCGIAKDHIYTNDKGKEIKLKIDAHHLMSRDVKDCPLKFDIMNGVAVDPSCHKFSIPSFHRDPVYTITWLQENYPERYRHVLKYHLFTVDLQNRKVLEEIESKLKEQLPLDLEKLKQIETEFPRVVKKRNTEIKGSLFDEDNESDTTSSED